MQVKAPVRNFSASQRGLRWLERSIDCSELANKRMLCQTVQHAPADLRHQSALHLTAAATAAGTRVIERSRDLIAGKTLLR